MADEQTRYLKEILIALAAVVTALGGKSLWDWLTGKTKAETKSINQTGDATLLVATDKAAQDYLSYWREAIAELKIAEADIRKSQKRLHNAALLTRKMLAILKQMNHESWEALEREAAEILE